ncbi:piggyBac transposable element-derived protein 4-like [Sinocyclocheilus rhinocerous]|nr:PREDICTED: piggyBac transposable element-derived protein 4-like [Sinocyclocheilus rhinocerous]
MSVNDGTERWNDCSVEDEVPALPNFLPKRNPGAQLVMDRIYSPLQLFQLFFTGSVVDTIVKNTNTFAKIRSEAGKHFLWLPLKAEELYSYIALVIYMGLLGAKNIIDYWSGKEIYRLPFPKSVMSRSRFQAISWNLHLCDPEDDRENSQKKGTQAYDRLFKIKPLYNDIVSACKTYFHPDRQLAGDERMVATRARIGIKQYMKDKPTKWGYKLYVLADSACGFTWNFFVYEGKSSLATGKGLSYDSVMQLLDLSLLGKGYQLFMDNFYTSPCLFMDLLAKKTLACGTIRTNRRGFPRTKANDLSRRGQRGTIRCLRDGKLLFVKWMDTREVTVCSTMHKAYDGDAVLRRVKNPEGEWERRRIPIPTAVKDYNKYIGGVDLSDALIGYYNVLHKTTKWYNTFFFHFVDIAVVNRFILHQHLSKAQNKSPLSQKEFRERLVSELATQSSTSGAPEPSTSHAPELSASTSHAPEPSTSAISAGEPCCSEYFGSNATSGRRVCALCKLSGLKVKTPMYCTK